MRALIFCLLLSACGTAAFELRDAPPHPFDAVIVPGCPANADGSLTLCQMARALWAARLWRLGWAQRFITSGAAVYSPYIEAESLAAALAALGVPADRIYLEPNALHTDENMYYSLQIARALGLHDIAVASDGAAWDCRMLLDWGQKCRSFTLDRAIVRQEHARVPGVLERVRAERQSDWIPRPERERQIAERTGRHRPPSYWLYLELGMMRTNGERWMPPGTPPNPKLTTWAQRLHQLY
jgi:hypothetical protein